MNEIPFSMENKNIAIVLGSFTKKELEESQEQYEKTVVELEKKRRKCANESKEDARQTPLRA